LIDGSVPILEVNNSQGLGLEYVDFEVVEQVLHDLLAVLAHEVWTNLQHELN